MMTVFTVLTIGILLSVALTLIYRGIKLYQNFKMVSKYNIKPDYFWDNCLKEGLFAIALGCASFVDLFFWYNVYTNCSEPYISGLIICNTILFVIVFINVIVV